MTTEQQIAVLRYRASSVQYTLSERHYWAKEARRLKGEKQRQKADERERADTAEDE